MAGSKSLWQPGKMQGGGLIYNRLVSQPGGVAIILFPSPYMYEDQGVTLSQVQTYSTMFGQMLQFIRRLESCF